MQSACAKLVAYTQQSPKSQEPDSTDVPVVRQVKIAQHTSTSKGVSESAILRQFWLVRIRGRLVRTTQKVAHTCAQSQQRAVQVTVPSTQIEQVPERPKPSLLLLVLNQRPTCHPSYASVSVSPTSGPIPVQVI